MAKRILAGIIGALALLACLFASAYAIMAIQDARPKDIVTAPWWAIAAEIAMCSAAFGGLLIGIRFLGFAMSGRSMESGGRWLKPILLGVGLFFPVFLLLILVGLYCVYHVRSHGNPDANAITVFKVSSVVGIAAAITGSGIFLRKAWQKMVAPKVKQ